MGGVEMFDPICRSSNKNPFCEDVLSNEVSYEIPSRTSNPLSRNAQFQRNEPETSLPYTASINGAPALG
jgi:hypothetical protein